MCHSLSDESVHAATVLSSWCKFPDAIPQDEIEVAFQDKSKHPKAKESIASTSDMIQVDSDWLFRYLFHSFAQEIWGTCRYL